MFVASAAWRWDTDSPWLDEEADEGHSGANVHTETWQKGSRTRNYDHHKVAAVQHSLFVTSCVAADGPFRLIISETLFILQRFWAKTKVFQYCDFWSTDHTHFAVPFVNSRGQVLTVTNASFSAKSTFKIERDPSVFKRTSTFVRLHPVLESDQRMLHDDITYWLACLE